MISIFELKGQIFFMTQDILEVTMECGIYGVYCGSSDKLGVTKAVVIFNL